MLRVLLPTVMSFLFLSAEAQNRSGKLSAGAALLFENVETTIATTEKSQIFLKTGLQLSADQKTFEIDGMTVAAVVFPTDMNTDGVEEIFVVMKSAALFGNVGENFLLYIKEESGAYEEQAGIGGGTAVILTTINLGYPDILVGTPNMQHPVFRWNGKQYARYKMLNDAVLSAKNATAIEPYSKTYTAK